MKLNVKHVIAVTEVIALLVVALVVFGPLQAKAQSGNIYAPGQAQQSGSVEEAIVLQVNVKHVEASSMAQAAGGAFGGVLGTAIGRRLDPNNRYLGQVIGATGGAIGGAEVAKAKFGATAQEIVVGIKDAHGTLVRAATIVQPAPYDAVSQGQRVLVVNIQGVYRVLSQQYAAAQH